MSGHYNQLPVLCAPVEEVCTVSRVHWVAQYNPPAAPEAAGQRRRDPEAVEQEMRQLERELQKLLLITIK